MFDDPEATKNPLSGDKSYSTSSHTRALNLIWPDGKMHFVSYPYLLRGTYDPEENEITLICTDCKVIIKGIKLQKLYLDIMGHFVDKIVCIEERYTGILEQDQFTVTDIQILN